MSKVGSWKTNAGANDSTPPDGWPEGQAPSTVNDCAREMMAAIRTYLTDAQYFDTGNTPSFLTSTTFSLNAADTTSFHVGRRVKLFDTSTLYGTIDSVSATFVSVRLDSGALTASLSSVAVSIIGNVNSPLPQQVWGRRNILINGSFDIWQRGNGSFALPSSTVTWTADRAGYLQSCGATCAITRAERSAATANVPTIAQAGTYINSSLRVSCNAADVAIGSDEFSELLFRIEGYDWRQLAHKPNILSFFASSNRSGVYCVAIRNTTGSLSFVQNYTISAVNSFSRYSITIPEAPTTATWDYSSGVGLLVTFALAVGSTYQGGAGNWTAANIIATSSQVNFVASAGNVFMITGMQLEEGTQATPLEVKQYADELARCQRYYWRGLPCLALNFPSFVNGSIMSWPVRFPVTMRTTPTVNQAFPGITLVSTIGAPTVNQPSPDGCRLIASGSAVQANSNFSFNISTDYVEADAEL